MLHLRCYVIGPQASTPKCSSGFTFISGPVLAKGGLEAALQICSGAVGEAANDEQEVAKLDLDIRGILFRFDALLSMLLIDSPGEFARLFRQTRKIRKRRPIFTLPVAIGPLLNGSLNLRWRTHSRSPFRARGDSPDYLTRTARRLTMPRCYRANSLRSNETIWWRATAMLAIDGTSGDQPVNGAYEPTWQSDPSPTRGNHHDEPGTQWLSINAACELLGVDKSTLRRWSDRGLVPVFRTPGGHRRYTREDLEEVIAGDSVEQQPISRRKLDAITRLEFERREPSIAAGRLPGTGQPEDCAAQLRTTCDQMIDLSIRYASGRGDADRLLIEGRDLARLFGHCTARSRLETSEAVESFLRFRRPMLDAIGRYAEQQHLPVRRSCRMMGKLNTYLDVMLTSLVEAHEAHLGE